MKFEFIELEISNSVATVWLNRPDVHNALNQQMINEIITVFENFSKDSNFGKDIRIVVLRGKGKSFCAGADLNYMKGIATFGFEENYQDSLNLAKCFNIIYTCKKPTIAVVHGASIGGANGLLAACDFVYAADDTKFAFSEVKLGIAPATISPYVTKRIGEYGSRDLMITGRRFTGKEAEWYRLVNKSVPFEELDSYVNSMIETLMTSGPNAMAACKELISVLVNSSEFGVRSSEAGSWNSKLANDKHSSNIDQRIIDYTARLIAELRASKEGQEGMASFLEKRKPNWIPKSDKD